MESSELDLSEFQEEDNDGHDGDDGSGGNEDNAPGQGGTTHTHLKDAYWAYPNASNLSFYIMIMQKMQLKQQQKTRKERN